MGHRSGGKTDGGMERPTEEQKHKQAGEARAGRSKKEVEEELEEMLDQVSLLLHSHLLLHKSYFTPEESWILNSLQSQSGKTFKARPPQKCPLGPPRPPLTVGRRGILLLKDDKTNVRCLLWVVRMTERSNALINRLSDA